MSVVHPKNRHTQTHKAGLAYTLRTWFKSQITIDMAVGGHRYLREALSQLRPDARPISLGGHKILNMILDIHMFVRMADFLSDKLHERDIQKMNTGSPGDATLEEYMSLAKICEDWFYWRENPKIDDMLYSLGVSMSKMVSTDTPEKIVDNLYELSNGLFEAQLSS